MNWIYAVIITTAALLLAAMLYVFLIAPRRGRPEMMKAFEGGVFAHRGLHDKNAGVPENTLLAFRRAVEHGYGMEFDVRFTADKQLVVMHDNDLERMTGVQGRVSEMTLEQLAPLRVGGTDQPIPRFEQVLETVDGRTPLIIELKVCGSDYAELAQSVCNVLDGYSGPYVIESFDPRLVHWLRRHRPDIARGQLLEYYRRHGSTNVPAVADFVLHNQLLNAWVRPDFIAIYYADRDSFSMRLSKRLFRTPEIDWTVRSAEEVRRSRAVGAGYIFEGFIPEPNRNFHA
ncbi:MAG: glycerophosphodiester phosphodiesterase [Ruminococcaceae bacterium]|nr:glycerophosphodiester phosphodiesterase [Oscillospiraceae bacterium]